MKSVYKDIGTVEDKFVEECGECLQALSKVKRFGIRNFNPNISNGNCNGYALLSELQDLILVAHDLESKIERDLRKID